LISSLVMEKTIPIKELTVCIINFLSKRDLFFSGALFGHIVSSWHQIPWSHKFHE
jgi:hypothetical protein